MTRHALLERLSATELVARTGRVRKILPTFIEADGPSLPLGALCEIETQSPGRRLLAEVVGVRPDAVVLAPMDDAGQPFFGARVVASDLAQHVPAGAALAGRAVDALGRAIDRAGPILADQFIPLDPQPAGAMDRMASAKMVETGIRALDGLLPLARGQRIGVFAPSGAGKTTLLTQLARQMSVDRCVICLVGERGREVEALWQAGLAGGRKDRVTLVAATSDQSAAMRVRACRYALALADHWRAQGEHVLFILDSVTRLAMALREVGLAAGEPPTVRAYTPGVFAAVPRIVELCGAIRSGGAITAVMSVLTETDDVDDPVAEMMKSLLDGHIVLSRELAAQRHFPAIDVTQSLSRLSADLLDRDQQAISGKALAALSTYETSKVMIESGLYVAGSNRELDTAIQLRTGLMSFLKQPVDEKVSVGSCRSALSAAVSGGALR